MNTFKSGVKYFGALLSIRKEMIIRLQSASDQALGFIYQTITVTGVIAGLGFTAISYANRLLFVLGESGLFLCIISSLFAVRYFWISGLSSTEGFNNEINLKSDNLKKALTDNDIKEIEKIVTDLEAQPHKPTAKAEKVEYIMTVMIIGLLISCALLLVSFLMGADQDTRRQEKHFNVCDSRMTHVCRKHALGFR